MSAPRLAVYFVTVLAISVVGPVAASGDPPPQPQPAQRPPATATLQEMARIQGFLGAAFCDFSPDNRLLVTGDGEGVFHFWDLVTFQERTRFDSKARYASCVNSRTGFSPDGGTFVIYGNLPMPKGADRRAEVTLFDVASSREIAHIPCVDPIVATKGTFLSVRRGELVVHFDLGTGREVRRLQAGPPSHSTSPQLFSPDGSLLFTSADEGKGRLWEVATGVERDRIDGYYPAFAKSAPVMATRLPGEGLPWAKRGDALDPKSPDGSVIKIWDTVTGNEKATIRGIEAPGLHMNLSPDGRLLLTSPWHTVLRPNGEQSLPQPAPPAGGKVGHLEIRLWDTETGREVVRFPGSIRYPRDAFFLADGHTVVFPRNCAGSEETELVFWDVPGHKERMTLRELQGIDTPRFSADGSMVVAVARDRNAQAGPLVLRFWDTSTGKEWVSDVEDERFQIVASMYTTFSPDGTMAAVPVPQGAFQLGAPAPQNELRVLKLSDRPLKRVILGKPVAPALDKPPPS